MVDGMTLRNEINTALKQAMRDRAAERLSTLRLISAAIKDRDIAARGEGNEEGVGEGRGSCDPGEDGQTAAGKRAHL